MKKLLSVVSSLLLLVSCNFLTSRENYDPWLIDGDACGELSRIDNCLERFKRLKYIGLDSEAMLDYYKLFYPLLTKEELSNFEGLIFKADPDMISANYKTNEDAYNNHMRLYGGRYNIKLSYDEAYELNNIKSAFVDWAENQYKRIEYLLYEKSGVEIFPKYADGDWVDIEIKNKEVYEKSLDEAVTKYYESLNTPVINWSNLVDDDHARYQIWSISKESDSNREEAISVVVLFDKDNNREFMKLFNP